MIRRRWDPTADLATMQQNMDRFFDDPRALRRAGWQEERRKAVLPLDAYSTDHELIIKASVSGVEPEDVEITIEGDRLTIRGEIWTANQCMRPATFLVLSQRVGGPLGSMITCDICRPWVSYHDWLSSPR